MKYRTILFDGRNTLFRAHYVSRPLLVDLPDLGANIGIGGVYQFIRIVLATVEEHGAAEGCSVVIAWEGDDDGTSWRRAMFPAYKANRDPGRHKTEDGKDFARQERILREVLSDLGWAQAWAKGFEADDALATMAARLTGGPREPIAIVTGDRDLHQCVRSRVHVLDREVWDFAKVRAKWGVEPSRIPEVKALAGDKSDGIPGVDGIGEKGAKEILGRWGSLEAAFDAIATLRDGDRTNAIRKLARATDVALLCRTLATVQQNAPLEFAPRLRLPVRDVFARYKFASLLTPKTIRAAELLAQ